MIELIVGFVLIGLLVATAGGSIMQAFSSSASTATTTAGRANAAEAAERFAADVRGTRALGRDGASIVDESDLQIAVRADGPLYDANGIALDWRDITLARTDRITFQADVVDEAANTRSQPECVTWSVETGAGGWWLRRVTRSYVRPASPTTAACAGGGGSIIEDDPMSRPNALTPRPGASGTPPLVTYGISRPIPAGGCRLTLAARTLTSDERNHVSSIRLDFSSLTQSNGTAARSTLRSEVTLRSRGGADYQGAMDCDA